ncbi:ATP-binding protein [Asanoa siamensis]|uniref:Histidine kinase/HSP90-like ATPase domain-containing protein n=1 Tax=Asanoa siamensis TaxID=926357 RepID=A0ABQ4CXF4_9ACTN|nr:hypothetical protein Asi02nite_54690 [Asanoa siamensis]
MDPHKPQGAGPPAITGFATDFAAQDLRTVRHAVATYLHDARVERDLAEDVVVAVNELLANAIRHGGGRGRLDLATDDTTITCSVTDYGGAAVIPTITEPRPDVPGGRGLWLVDRLCDTLDIDPHPDGLTVTVNIHLTSPWPTTRR